MESFRTHWKLLLVVLVVSAIGIQLFEPSYNELQVATDAVNFRHTLDHPNRAVAAALCDIVFAMSYGVLGVVGLRAAGERTRAIRLGMVAIVAAAAFDELENLLLLGNIARRQTITDGWIVAMRVPGTLKWVGTPAFLLLFWLLPRAVRRARSAG